MADLPSIATRIQVEQTQFRAPVSESLMEDVGGSINFILDHYMPIVGMVVDFAGPEVNVPSGWIVCDGRAVSRVGFSNLFGVIGTYWGIGDGLSTFNVPDMRGIFNRMVDLTLSGQAGKDPQHASRTPLGTGTSEEPGSYEADAFQNHTHTLPSDNGSHFPNTFGAHYIQDTADYIYTSGSEGASSETRPKNVYVFRIIKT